VSTLLCVGPLFGQGGSNGDGGGDDVSDGSGSERWIDSSWGVLVVPWKRPNALSSVKEAYSESIKRPIGMGIDSCETWYPNEVVTT
jgi:hypothetical protein